MFLAVLLGASQAIAAAGTSVTDPSILKSVAESPGWLRLLHFKHSFPFGTPRSEVSQGTFFIAPDGRHNPLAELEATVDLLMHPRPWGSQMLAPQCAFPARYHYLKTALHWDIEDVACPELDAFMKRVDADELSLVFSAAYPNSPPSMFGHTLVRAHSRRRVPLLDYGINYAAVAGPDENAIAFAVLGLAGGYFGQFSVVPYYMKVNEYNNAESRDLWEYDLNLTPAEVRVFLWHVWELDLNALFRYYFFDENCSYRILTVLEVAKPEWDLSRFVFEVVPAETVKALVETPGAVKAIHYRPSLHRRMVRRFDELSAPERKAALDLVHDPSAEALAAADPATLEAAIAYWQFKQLKESNHLDGADQAKLDAFLRARARQGAVTSVKVDDPSVLPENRPERGHAPYLLGVGAGSAGHVPAQADFEELHFKFAYHDLLNNDTGYTSFSQADFPNLALRYSAGTNSLWIERLGIITVTSLAPMTALDQQLSWKIDLSYISPKDLSCLDCHAIMAEGGAGATLGFQDHHLLLYSLALLHLEAGSSIANGVRFTPKLLGGVLAQPWSFYKMQLTGAAVADVWQSVRQSHFYEFAWDHSWSLAQNWEVRFDAKAVLPGDRQENVTYEEYGLYLNRYF